MLLSILILTFTVSTAIGLTNATELQDLKISVWPEYDKTSEALIMYRGQLPDNVKLPAKVTFLYPKSARLSSTSSVDDKNQFQYTKEWASKKVVDKGDFVELTYNVNFPTFQFEVYDQVKTGSDKRDYKFPYKAGMDVKNLSVEMQQPLRSESFKVTPKSSSSGKDDQGFTFHTYNVGKLKTGDQKDFSATYTKSDINPSTNSDGPQPVSSGPGQMPKFWVIIVTVATLLAIPVAVVFNLNRNKPSKPKKKAVVPPKKAAKPSGKAKGFCTQCGTAIQPGNQFCPSCGKKV